MLRLSAILLALVQSASSGSSSGDSSGLPWPPGGEKRCPQIQVTCDISRCGPHAAACADPSGCEILISPAMCRAMGLQKGGYPNSAFQRKAQCTDSTPAQVLSRGLKAFGEQCCQIRHEYSHLVDPEPKDHDESRFGCGEAYAEGFENYCLDRVIETYCSGDAVAASPKLRRSCMDLCFWKRRQALERIWDGCVCSAQGAGAFSQASCNRCREVCQSGAGYPEIFTPACKALVPGWNEPSGRTAVCARLVQTSAHSCEYYRSLSPSPAAAPQSASPGTTSSGRLAN